SNYAYDNWHGLVFVLKNFQLMDAGIPVLAAGNGKILIVEDGHPDRTKQYDTGGYGNYIWIQHNPDLYSFYGFLSNHSIRVKEDQVVKKGDTIAMVGSSGVSYSPKLYFLLEDAFENVMDPLGNQCASIQPLLSPGPIYDTSFGIIDFGVTNNIQYSNDTLIERPPTVSEISVTDDPYACVWLQAKNLFEGDQIGSLCTDPHGNIFWDKRDDIVNGSYHFDYDRNYAPTYLLDTGIWNVTFYYNYDSVCHIEF